MKDLEKWLMAIAEGQAIESGTIPMVPPQDEKERVRCAHAIARLVSTTLKSTSGSDRLRPYREAIHVIL